MVQVKICGLTSVADVEIVNRYLPDYVGFVFAPGKRQVTLAQAVELAAAVSKDIKKVGVFVNCPKEQVKVIADACNLDILQFHGQESPVDCYGYKYPIWKAFNVKDAASLVGIKNYDVAGILVDSYHPQVLGGTGVSFDWSLVKELSQREFLILAGGLNVSNLEDAITLVQPAVVDVSSGVESNGRKDEMKIKQFIEKARKLR